MTDIQRRPLPREKGAPSPLCRACCNRLGWCLCIMIGLMQLIWWLPLLLADDLSKKLPVTPGTMVGTAIETAAYLMLFILPGCLYFVFSKKKAPPAEPIRVSPVMPRYFPLLILCGMAVIIVAANVNAFFIDLIEFDWIYDAFPAPIRYTDGDAVAEMIITALAPAFAEEFMFRGVCYGNMRRYGRPFALTASAVLFALMHQNPAQTFYTFCAGLVMGLCYELSGSIWCGVFLHLFNNLFAVFGDVLYDRLGDNYGAIMTLVDAAIILLGLGSALWLYVILRRQRETDEKPTGGGLFGNLPPSLPSVTVEYPDTLSAVRAFFAPGMIVYVSLSLACTVLGLFGILLI